MVRIPDKLSFRKLEIMKKRQFLLIGKSFAPTLVLLKK